MSTVKRFRTILVKDERTEATSITVPFDVREVFRARGRVPVRGTINGFEFRTSLFSMKGSPYFMVVNKETREGAKVKGGDTVAIVMQRDDEPRTITPPPDLLDALKKNDVAMVAWERLSYTHLKEHVKAIEEAKKPETRTRRIEKAVEQLVTPKQVR